MSTEAIIEYARRIREQRRAGPSNLEQALAPEFQRLLESLLPLISSNELVVVPEFATLALVGRTSPSSALVSRRAPLSSSRRPPNRAILRAIAILTTSSSSSVSSRCRFGRSRIFRAFACSGATSR
jgi:hypothetical protein